MEATTVMLAAGRAMFRAAQIPNCDLLAFGAY